MIFSSFRKIRLWFRRRKQRISELDYLGRPTFIHDKAEFRFPGNIHIGQYCRIGEFCSIDGEGGVRIGDGTILAPHVIVLSSSHIYLDTNILPYSNMDKLLPVLIGRGCWIGWGAKIVPGVKLGDGVVVGMGAVVTKDLPSGSVAVGNPAKVIKERDLDSLEESIKSEHYYLKLLLEAKLPTRSGRRSNVTNNLFWLF